MCIRDRVVDKLWQMWLPVQNALNIGTAFLKPDSSTTLTIPSTAVSYTHLDVYKRQVENQYYWRFIRII